MQNKIEFNGIEIEYDDALIEKVREAYNLPVDVSVSEEKIVSFFEETMQVAINKGYAVIDDEKKQEIQ